MGIKSKRKTVNEKVDDSFKFGLNLKKVNPSFIDSKDKNQNLQSVIYSYQFTAKKGDPFSRPGFGKTSAPLSAKKKHWKKHLKHFNREFFNTTTIGGLKRILGKDRLKNWYFRLFWSVMWLAVAGLVYLLCKRHIDNYYSFEVDTRMHYETMTSLDFPAVTMCNENLFRKSVVGGSFTAMLALATTVTNDPKAMYKTALENNKSCYQNHVNSLAKQFEREGLDFIVKLGYKKFMHLAAMDANVVAMKCWWQNVETECANVLLNRASDFNWCFSFNPSKHFLAEKSDRIEPTRQNYVKRQSVINSERQGFRILLNTNQKEYCGAGRKYFNNPGFIVKLHDPAIMPYIKSDKSIYIGPGFSYRIFIRPTIIQRQTEHLGKCRSSMNSILYPDIDGYFQDACRLEELAKMIWEKCRCYAIGYDGFQADIANLVNVPQTKLALCWNQGLFCAGKVDVNLSNIPVETAFPHCKQACREVHYDYVISSTKLPSIIGMPAMETEYNVSDNVGEIRKNAILADFFFDTMTVLIIEEFQKYTLLDVFRNFGGIMSLFLGVSVVTLAEVAYIALYWSVFYAKILVLKMFI